jgi:CheY-like chemotaxis protein
LREKPAVARILIVDDEPDVRELFNITLKMAGHVTDTAKHGLEAVDKLKVMPEMPELIVLDLMMPHLDGFGLLSHIRNEMTAKPFRVLVATAKVLEESDQEKLSTWPVVGVLNKGELDIGRMVMIVTTALGKNPLKEAAAAASGATTPPKEVGGDTKDAKEPAKEPIKKSTKELKS